MSVFMQQLVNGLVLGGAYVLVALGLFVVFNALHIPNFAHGEMYALGAYFQYLLVVQLGFGFLVSVPLVVVLVAAVGVLSERFVFRRLSGASLTAMLLASLALAIVLQELMSLAWGSDPLAVPGPLNEVRNIGDVRLAEYRLLLWVVIAVVTVALAVLIYRSSFGRDLRALAQNRELAQLSGIDVRRISSFAFALGAGLAGLAGALLSPTTSVHPHMGFHLTLVAFVVLVVVGAGGRMASVVAIGLALAVLETLTAGYISNTLRVAVVFVVLVAFLSVRPEGAVRGTSAAKVHL